MPSGVEFVPCETHVQHANVGCINSTEIYCDEKRIHIQTFEQPYESYAISNLTDQTTIVPIFDYHIPDVNHTTNETCKKIMLVMQEIGRLFIQMTAPFFSKRHILICGSPFLIFGQHKYSSNTTCAQYQRVENTLK